MDLLIIGKASFSRNAAPVVVYCGPSRADGLVAARAALPELPFMYYVNPEPYHRITPSTAAPKPTTPAPSPEVTSVSLEPEIVKPADKPKPKKK